MDLHIRDVLKKYIKQDRKVGNAYYSQKITNFWEEQLGESINKRTSSIVFRRGQLIVKVTSAPLRQELFNNKKNLMQRINEFLKEDAITSIDFN